MLICVPPNTPPACPATGRNPSIEARATRVPNPFFHRHWFPTAMSTPSAPVTDMAGLMKMRRHKILWRALVDYVRCGPLSRILMQMDDYKNMSENNGLYRYLHNIPRTLGIFSVWRRFGPNHKILCLAFPLKTPRFSTVFPQNPVHALLLTRSGTRAELRCPLPEPAIISGPLYRKGTRTE